MAKDPKKEPGGSSEAQEKLKKQKHLQKDMSGALMAGRVAASTQRQTKVRVPTQQINEASGGARSATIPDPGPRRRHAPPPGAAVLQQKAKKSLEASQPRVKAKQAPSGPAPGQEPVPWDPARLEQFLTGGITLGELEGVSKEEQYEIAKSGHQLLQQGKLDKAKQVFLGLATLDPYDAYFHLALGSIAQRDDELEEAEARYSRALEISPRSCHAYANRGEVRLLRGNVVEGAKDLLQALEEDPDCIEEATQRAQATINVVIEQLREAEAAEAAQAGTASEAKTVQAQTVGPRPRKAGSPGVRKGPAPRRPGQGGPRSAGPRSGDPRSGGPRSGGPRSAGPRSGGPRSGPRSPGPRPRGPARKK